MIETLADKLNRLLQDENAEKNGIRKIPVDIYKQITSHIKSIRSESSDRSEGRKDLVSSLGWAEREILLDIASRLIQLRISKFIRDPESDSSNLTLEERYIAEPLIQSKKRKAKIEDAMLNGHIAQLDQVAGSVKQKFVIARFLKSYSAITGTDLASYGPFEQEDVAILPIENAKNLAKSGVIAKRWLEPGE